VEDQFAKHLLLTMNKFFTLAVLFVCTFSSIQAQFSDNFGTTTSGSAPSPCCNTATVTSPLSADANPWTGGTVFFGGTSGGAYCIGTNNGNGTYTLTLTNASPSFDFTITGISFQARRTSTGPSTVAVSANGTPVTMTGAPGNGSFSPLTSGAISVVIPPNTTFTITITTSGGTGASQNIRLDDFALTGALPVTLMSFTGKLEAGTSLLSFSTATERNNSHFIIERSADGKVFENIGRVAGNGNSTSRKDYTFEDKRPLKGINYYRLKQVDFDGKFEYSAVVSVQNGRTGNITIAPSPATDLVQVRFEESTEEAGRYEVYDATGRLVLNGEVMAESNVLEMNVSALVPGIYSLRLQNGRTAVTKQFRVE
jgi:hypothetical protein